MWYWQDKHGNMDDINWLIYMEMEIIRYLI